MGIIYDFEGMMAPVFTPFKNDGSLNLDVIPLYANYLYSKGVKGVYVAGTAGEGLSLTVAERKLLTEAWVESSSKYDLKVMAMIGAVALVDVFDLAKHAEATGVSAIAVLPCLYDKPSSVDALVSYCSKVAEVAPSTRLFYYHIPFKTGVNLPMDEFLEKGEAKIETLAGIKFTSNDVSTEGLRCLEVCSGKFNIFSGFDDKLYEALSVGFRSAINSSFNFLGGEASEIFGFFHEASKASGEHRNQLLRKAKSRQEKISQVLESIFAFTGGFSVSSIKAAMTLLSPVDVGPPREPQRRLSGSDEDLLRSKLSSLLPLE